MAGNDTERAPAPPQVQVDAHVIRQLGDQLVTDAEQALIELIKNCWDADAQRVRITIDTSYREEGDPPALTGRILVDDDGCGMNRDAIINGWLTISLSLKREMKKHGKTTLGLGRTPLGDKGLGRLGTMKLGNTVRISTFHSQKEPGHFVELAWNDFKSGQLLSKVRVRMEDLPATGRTGTKLDIRGLNDPQYWRGERRLKDLQGKLSTLVSPFEEFAKFKTSIRVDENSVELEKVGAKLRDTAAAQFSCAWDDDTLQCNARCKLSLFEGTDEDKFLKWVTEDSGKALFKYLAALPAATGFSLSKADGNWFVELAREWKWTDIAAKKPGTAVYAKPGPLRCELDSFGLGSGESTGTFSKHEDYKAFVKRQAGVRVYRDGFGIRMPDDWLGLGKAQTSGRSFYGLRPVNTVGFVAISAAHNPLLEEKSDREGFIDSAPVRGFYEILGTFVKFCNDALTFLRRSYNDYLNERTGEEVSLPTKWEPADALEQLKKVARAAKQQRKAVEAATEERKAKLERVRSTLTKVLSTPSLPLKTQSQLTDALEQFNRALGEVETHRRELDGLVDHIADEEKLAEAILDRFGQLRRQIDDVYETVGLGLVAQALAHDIHALVDDLLNRSQKVARRVRDSGDSHIVGYLEAVRATANAVRKQLTFLDPMLRAARETRQTIALSEFVREFIDLRRERLQRFGITAKLDVDAECSVKFNRGRLLQVFDNLFRNAEYWLRQYSETHKKAVLEIRVVIDSSGVVVWDTGPGVKPALERTLFDLFVTDKPVSEGSGLGLFILRQLLVAEECSVQLGSERNDDGRRYRFEIDFSGALAK